MEPLADLIKNKGSESAVIKGAKAALTVEEANNILTSLFGRDCKKFIEAVYLKNKTLGLKVSGSTAAAEAKMNEEEILAKIREKFGQNSVLKIRFVI